MRNQYFAAGTIGVAVNYKAASATVARAIIQAHHLPINKRITTPPGSGNGIAYAAGLSPDTYRWHGKCPKIAIGDTTSAVLVVRNPVDRFISACAETGTTDVNALLDRLELDTEHNPHFWPQSRFSADLPTLYRFDRDLQKLAIDLNLDWPLPNIIRHDKPTKPTLTQSQTDRVLQIYADDLTLYQSTE